MKLIFQSEIQRTEQLAVSFFSFFVDTLSKVIGFSFILCHCHIFKDRHGRAGSHRRILKNASDSSHAFIFRHICDIGAVDQNSSFINRNAPTDNIQHGSFSGTVAADNRNKLTVIDFKIKIVEQAHFIDCARIIVFINFSEFKHRLSP